MCIYLLLQKGIHGLFIGHLFSRVFAADVDANRLALAKEMGADIIINNSVENLKEVR